MTEAAARSSSTGTMVIVKDKRMIALEIREAYGANEWELQHLMYLSKSLLIQIIRCKRPEWTNTARVVVD